jgi:DNA-binding NtrC family response regulator
MQIERIALHFRSVLIRGDRGTGKKLVARMLHAKRGDVAGTFLPLNAEAIEACRQARGAFGRCLEGAGQTTLFLDGVDEFSFLAQDWLLETLVCGKSIRGPKKTPGIEMRVIASTTQDLRALASAGRFRPALYRWMAAVEIAVPPLRERIEDIPELATHFLVRFARLHGKRVYGIADEAMSELLKHRWPGNVRELRNVIRDGVFRCNADFIEPHHLVFAQAPEVERFTPDVGAESVRLDDVVMWHVLGVLKGCGGNKLRAAEMLGISRSTLYRMLEAGGSEAVLR